MATWMPLWPVAAALALSAQPSWGVRRDAIRESSARDETELIDVGPMFRMMELHAIAQRALLPREADDDSDSLFANLFTTKQGQRFKCCSNGAEWHVVDIDSQNACDKSERAFSKMRNRWGCGCFFGYGFRSYTRFSGKCTVPVAELTDQWDMQREEVLQAVADALVTRYIDGWKISYGPCSTTCGHGRRERTDLTCIVASGSDSGECSMDAAELIPEALSCMEMDGCEWKCSHEEDKCGWGKVECQDSLTKGKGQLCGQRAALDKSFPIREHFLFESCFKQCQEGQALSSMCAVTTNHLDEQYKSLENLIDKTCASGKTGAPDGERPDLIVLMTQELNHANGFISIATEKNVFPKYVNETALPGYTMSGECVGPLSANSAIFVRSGKENQLYPRRMDCTGDTLRSNPCDWSNCKGSIVMDIHTSFGKLVVGNWHGDRAGTESMKRVQEFEDAVNAIQRIEPYLGKKLVVFGGDINVRSWMGDKKDPLPVDPSISWTGEQLSAKIPDILGYLRWTMDKHLAGEVGISALIKEGLKREPLYQAKGWNTLCPTKTKTTERFRIVKEKEWNGRYKKSMLGIKKKKMVEKIREVPNMLCYTPADQMANGRSSMELTSMEKIYGGKSNTPSWTDRIFLSKDLFDACGKLMKDTRNLQDDHDPVFVRCKLPLLRN